jgi:sialic acid synthase SpsE|tara:strand:+ start:2373 stop:3395 length:1023 start_codon:yes stop_codon:yes gene_type:complete
MKNKFFKIGKKYIGENKKIFIIAEIGINHGGNFKKCIKMINAAARSGADSVKIQTNDVNESYAPRTASYKEFKFKNFSDKELLKLKRYSESLGVIFFSSPGDIKSLKRLIRIKIPVIKISSGLATNLPLIGEVIRRKIPIIISTGFSDKKDLDDLKKFINKFNFRKIAILKCTSIYPASSSELDLNSIKFLKEKFNLPVGYSDHSMGDLATVVAVSCGATIIEKHFTLNKLQKGADHKISLEPKEFINMVNKIRTTEEMLGKKVFRINDEIKKKRNMYLRYLTAKKDIKKGDVLSLDNIGFFRHNRKKSGLEPKYFFHLKSKKSKANFRKNQIISKKILN